MKKFKISDQKFHPDSRQSFSCHRGYQTASPLPTALLIKAAEQVVRHAGQLAAIEGIIPGHLKLLIKSGDSGLILSSTRLDHVEKTSIGQWPELVFIENYHVTINFNLLIPVDFSEDEILEALQPDKITVD